MTPTLVLFGKAPRFGTVKRRLARVIGPVEALRFHRTQMHRLTRTLGRDPRWRTVWAVTPPLSGPWRGGLPLLDQGHGDLGQRMWRTLHAAAKTAPAAAPVVLIGTDIPAVTPAHIARAFALLRTADVVFGPAEDGGFWLVGLSRRRPLPSPFTGVRWSTADALADTLTNLGAGPCRRIAFADRLADRDI